MGKKSAIQWTDGTFNPWRGCHKISEGCVNCYAAAQSKRNPAVLGQWGISAIRSIGAEAYWEIPRILNQEAIRTGRRQRLFCGSLMDIWEERFDLLPHRARVLDLIATTPNVDWLLLSKRPENWRRCLTLTLPDCGPAATELVCHWLSAYYRSRPAEDGCGLSALEPAVPKNVWIGWTVENDARAKERCEAGLAIPAVVNFVSAEPLLDLPDLRPYLGPDAVNWLIVGGESGPKSRPFNPDWARVLLDMAGDAGVPFFMKQMGDNNTSGPTLVLNGDEWDGIPRDLRVRQFPVPCLPLTFL